MPSLSGLTFILSLSPGTHVPGYGCGALRAWDLQLTDFLIFGNRIGTTKSLPRRETSYARPDHAEPSATTCDHS